MNRSNLILLVAALVQVTPIADADADEFPEPVRPQADSNVHTEQVVPPSPPAPSARHWYGGQPLIADGAALAVIYGSRAAQSRTGVGMGAVGWVVGAPAVHVAHRRPIAALASLAIRATFPLVGWYVGRSDGQCETICTTAVGSCANDPNGDYWHVTSMTCGDTYGAIGGLVVGGLLASTIDSALLSWEEPTVPSTVETAPRAAAPARRGLTLETAGVVPLQAGAALSLGGRF